jgi:DNA-binding protein HU-beta
MLIPDLVDILERSDSCFGLSRKTISKIIHDMFGTIMTTLESGEQVSIRGFGTFELRHRKARKIKGIKYQEDVILEEHHKIFFKSIRRLRTGIKGLDDSEIEK